MLANFSINIEWVLFIGLVLFLYGSAHVFLYFGKAWVEKFRVCWIILGASAVFPVIAIFLTFT